MSHDLRVIFYFKIKVHSSTTLFEGKNSNGAGSYEELKVRIINKDYRANHTVQKSR